jgi:hypothetical protein
MGEVYKRIDQYDYQISNHGNVRHISTHEILEHIFDKPGEVRKWGNYPSVHIPVDAPEQKHIKYIHRLVALHFVPNPRQDDPNVKVVDHINRNPHDNHHTNLRWLTQAENCRNKNIASNNTSGITGVRKEYNRWVSHIYINGVYERSSFLTKKEAIRDRLMKEVKYGFTSETPIQKAQRDLNDLIKLSDLLDAKLNQQFDILHSLLS